MKSFVGVLVWCALLGMIIGIWQSLPLLIIGSILTGSFSVALVLFDASEIGASVDSDFKWNESNAKHHLQSFAKWFCFYSRIKVRNQNNWTGNNALELQSAVTRSDIPFSSLSLESNPIGEGAEGYVYRLANDPTMVVKLFKQPNDPSYIDANTRQAAQFRITTQQQKMRRFPAVLPKSVVAPDKVVCDDTGQVVGFTMPWVDNKSPLRGFLDPSYRPIHLTDAEWIGIIAKLFFIVDEIHRSGCIIGDLNPDNILLIGKDPIIIDCDSFQFGNFHSTTFMPEYLCPDFADPSANEVILVPPYSEIQDRYALYVMLFTGLTGCHPYGGAQSKKLANQYGEKESPASRRSRDGVSVFSKSVIYPASARPLNTIPNELMKFFQEYFGNQRYDMKFDLAKLYRLAGLQLPNTPFKFDELWNNKQLVIDSFMPSVTMSQTVKKELDGSVVTAKQHGNSFLSVLEDTDKKTLIVNDSIEISSLGLSTVDVSDSFLVFDKGNTGADRTGTALVQSLTGNVISINAKRDISGNLAVATYGDMIVFIRDKQLRTLHGGIERAIMPIDGDIMFFPGNNLGLVCILENGQVQKCILFSRVKDALSTSTSEQLPIPGTLDSANWLSTQDEGWLLLAMNTPNRTGGQTVKNFLIVLRENGSVITASTQDAGVRSVLGSIEDKCLARITHPLCLPRTMLLSAGPKDGKVYGYECLHDGITCTEHFNSPVLKSAIENGCEAYGKNGKLYSLQGRNLLTVNLRHPFKLGFEMAKKRTKHEGIEMQISHIPRALLCAAIWESLVVISYVFEFLSAIFSKKKPAA